MPYPVALAITLLVEVPLYVGVLRGTGLVPTGRAVALALGVNLVTHPIVWAVLVHAGGAYPLLFVVAETGAVLVEAGLLYLVVRREPLLLGLLALTANAASALLGLAVAWLGAGRPTR